MTLTAIAEAKRSGAVIVEDCYLKTRRRATDAERQGAKNEEQKMNEITRKLASKAARDHPELAAENDFRFAGKVEQLWAAGGCEDELHHDWEAVIERTLNPQLALFEMKETA